MRLYTRTGDEGMTRVKGGKRAKDSVRVEAYGSCDELNCFVGRAVSLLTQTEHSDIRNDLTAIQHEIFDCASDLSNIREAAVFKVKKDMIDKLETLIDTYQKEVRQMNGSVTFPAPAQELVLCASIAKRIERKITTLHKEEQINEIVLAYMNRLSDFLNISAKVVSVRENAG
ncbi:cob(I)yrinic acid a,c-diamide adenosyltransferase [Bacillus sp. FJAT-44742]|uniref:cob(I)yrinic acid a,c-diamide adenosyltransferase n=1 Tax=Bacillus sp. FJAT-44742 TaxID=2014005 RepID=UPI000C238906|nr:cob(I)yrinic acid a,c-diamide adenosyltransferase [Bacillus sp. FJAT-44742]